jgi:polysaccharide export outer membrane protein
MRLTNVRKLFGHWGLGCGLALAGLVHTGCKSESGHSATFAEVPLRTNTLAGGGAAMVQVPGPAPAAATNGAPPGAPFANELKASEIIKSGDMLKITFDDLPPPPLAPAEQKIKEDGTITLLLNQEFTAVGKTRGELEREIRSRYVPDFYKSLTVHVEPLSATQFYYVDGEVKLADRQVYISRMTVLKAIASAKGFTDFAKKSKVVLTRLDGRKFTVNCIKAERDPRLDLEVFPGDKIWVPRNHNPFKQ